MSDFIGLLIFGVICSIIGFCSSVFHFHERYNASNLIEKCEQELPRTQKCVLIAVPDESE